MLQMDAASRCTLIVDTSGPLHILKRSLAVMYTHVSSSFLCVTLRGRVHAPFPCVHNLLLFFYVCFFISFTRADKFGNLLPAGLYNEPNT